VRAGGSGGDPGTLFRGVLEHTASVERVRECSERRSIGFVPFRFDSFSIRFDSFRFPFWERRRSREKAKRFSAGKAISEGDNGRVVFAHHSGIAAKHAAHALPTRFRW